MELFQIDEAENLFISPEIDDWRPIFDRKISIIIDLDGAIDIGVPLLPNELMYIYFPIKDADLPDLQRLHALCEFGASLIKKGHRVLAHCGLGCNRSALVAGVIMTYLGVDGASVVPQIRKKRPGALYNKHFADYLRSL